ncbi:MAG: hypothetical protein AAFX57_13425 [Bacteroidota bacterium]
MQTARLLKTSLYLSIIFTFLSCRQEQKKSTEEMTTEETAASEDVIEPALESTEFDSSGYKIIIDELRGIEKFYVQEDLYRLHSLLKFKDDERYKVLEHDLSTMYEHPLFLNVTMIDPKNGYVEFRKVQS